MTQQQLPICTYCFSFSNWPHKQQRALDNSTTEGVSGGQQTTRPLPRAPRGNALACPHPVPQAATNALCPFLLFWINHWCCCYSPCYWKALSRLIPTRKAQAGEGSQGTWAAKLYTQVVPVQKGNRFLVPLHTLRTCMATGENTAKWLHSNPRNPFTLPRLRKKYQCRKGCVTQQRPKMLIYNCKKLCEASTLVRF